MTHAARSPDKIATQFVLLTGDRTRQPDELTTSSHVGVHCLQTPAKNDYEALLPRDIQLSASYSPPHAGHVELKGVVYKLLAQEFRFAKPRAPRARRIKRPPLHRDAASRHAG